MIWMTAIFWRRPQRDRISIDPVFTGGERAMWQPSPDNDQIRQHLLALLNQIGERPRFEYPAGLSVDEIVVWQLGEFKESLATEPLRPIASFDPSPVEDFKFGRTRKSLAQLAERPWTRSNMDRPNTRMPLGHHLCEAGNWQEAHVNGNG